ncbi:hypothetical protein HYR54_04825 [Candidatus Acetothermia bacterium]|nr:hypothetical protein [Candidatus Acetothermia bacterium]MBI3461078.1 hypothetical protein [Candidatus Acetothermia bacterium]MBI3659585.1 hypothetical protein [Candidatus Acetothermia bacterium]
MHDVPMMPPAISFNFEFSSFGLDLPAEGFDPLAPQRVDGYVFNDDAADAGDDGKR